VVGGAAQLLHQARPRVQAPPLLRHGHHRQPRRKVACTQRQARPSCYHGGTGGEGFKLKEYGL
jgi:hypothetical protein